ncbi:DUF454 domain-containing protein [bacterium]|nr:MAG: DUF454 domain-containing protein [bacterium]
MYTRAVGARALRGGYLALGLLCVGLGLVGAVLPLMPSTVFFIVALWAFKRSSPSLEAWLLARSPVLRDWDETRSMTRRTKVLAIGLIWVTIAISAGLVIRKRWDEWVAVAHGASWSAHPYLLAPPILFVVALTLTWFLATRKTKIPGT